LTSIVATAFFVPGSRDLLGSGVSDVWIENDGRFRSAFRFGTVEEDDLLRIEAAPGALLCRASASTDERHRNHLPRRT